MIASVVGALESHLGALPVSVDLEASATRSINYRFYDFFNVPFRPFWDLRHTIYERPMNAECYTQAGIDQGLCTPSDLNTPDVASFPYGDWWPYPGQTNPGSVQTIPFIFAPYRMTAIGVAVENYNLAQPVYLPVLAASAPAGGLLEIDWRMDYIDLDAAEALQSRGCPITPTFVDGYYIRSMVTVTLDLPESRRIFGVNAADATAARAWWQGAINPACGTLGTVETAVQDFFQTMGGRTGTGIGKYDVWASYEWQYIPFSTEVSASVAADGRTTVVIDHVAQGTEVLLGRMFYWGPAGFLGNDLDSTRANGWFGMEMPWYEHFVFTARFAETTHDFELSTAMWSHLQAGADPGPNGILDRTDDIPVWVWGPTLSDYILKSGRPSELRRYPSATFTFDTPGSYSYGTSQPFYTVPETWDLKAGESWTFELPTQNVVFYDPNRTPLGADPTHGQFVEVHAPLALLRTNPLNYGSWDPQTSRWTVTGPTTTGGPIGTPGPDGRPGTPDDQYPLESFGAIKFAPGPALRIGVQVQAPWTQLAVGQSMNLFATAMAGGAPLAGAAMGGSVSGGGGTLSPGAGTTDANGMWSTTFTPSAAAAGTTVSVTFAASLADYLSGSGSYSVAVLAEPLSMSIASMTSNRQEMMSFEVATIRVQLSSGVTGVEDGLLTPSTRFGGTFTAVADLGGGAYEFGWTAPVRTTQGFARIDVRARAGGYTDATSFTTILVDPNKTNEIDPTQLFLLTSAPTSVQAGSSVVVTIYLFTIEGFVVSGGTVTARLFGPGSVTVVVDALNGVYRLTYNAPASVAGPTNIRIDITAIKFGYAVGTTRVGITVLP